MTDVVPLKPGEILVPKPGMWTSYKQIELKARMEFKGKVYWAIAMKSKSDGEWLDTLGEETLRNGWVRKPKFFQVGKTYRFQSTGRLDTWKIMDLYQLENPESLYKDVMAVAIATSAQTGKTNLETLTRWDFDRMTEA